MSIDIATIALREKVLTPESVQELRGKVTQLLEGIGRIIQDLRPPVLDDLGLESAVRWLIERHLLEKGVRCQLNTSEIFSRLASEVRDEKTVLTIFRIIQETIINVSKHAQATEVNVDLSYVYPNLIIEIEDDGVGFDVKNVIGSADTVSKSGFGIMGLRERVALLDGTLRIHSTTGEGTRVSITIPLNLPEVKDV
jgi:signal transduction histidine kinase